MSFACTPFAVSDTVTFRAVRVVISALDAWEQMEATVPRISATRVLIVESAGFAARAELTEKRVELKQNV